MTFILELTLKDLIKPQDAIFLDLLRKLLVYDPRDRITAREALNHPFLTRPL